MTFKRSGGLRPLDVTRLAQAAQRPGIDPRTWVFVGRVIEVEYEGGELVVVVKPDEGGLMGEPITCEVARGVASSSALTSQPVREGDIAIGLAFGGDANNLPVVIAFVHGPDTLPPSEVNGQTIDAALLAGSHVLADPERSAEVELAHVRVVAKSIELGPTPEPTQPFVRGQAFVDALGAFLDGLNTLVGTPTTGLTGGFTLLSAASVSVLTPLKPGFEMARLALTAFKPKIAVLKSHLVEGDALSKTITGE